MSPQGSDTYQALNPKNRRRSTRLRPRSENFLLTDNRRKALQANALDVHRNMGLLAWAIRRTLDYCCLFDFQPRTNDRGLNVALRELMERDTQAEAIDYYGRMDWDDMRRIAQAQQLLAGDAFFVRVNGSLQMVEGAFCQNPTGRRDQGQWVGGAKLVGGRVRAWNFAEEDPRTGQAQDRIIKAGSVWQYCQHEARPNQIRPVAPIVAALNEFRDLDETFDHMRAKVKLDQLFGIAFARKEDSEAFDEDDDEASSAQEGASRVVDFGDGPAVFDLDEGESVETIQSQTPAASTQEFLQLCTQIALKSLDLSYSMFSENFTNYSGSRMAWIGFERACHTRRKTQRILHDKMARWRLYRWFLRPEFGGTGELNLPSGMTPEDVRFRWVPRGVAWWKPQEELDTALRSVAAGLKSMQDVCDEFGLGDYLDNVAEIAKEREELEQFGFLQKWSDAAMVRLTDGSDSADSEVTA